MAALEVRNAGYPSRMTYTDFVRNYCILTIGLDMTGKTTDKERTAHMMTSEHLQGYVDSTKFKLGRTKLFMRAEFGVFLSQLKNKLQEPHAQRIQKWWLNLGGAFAALVQYD